MIKFLLKNIRIILISAVLITILFMLVFNDNGLLKYYHLKKEVNSLNEDIKRVDTENKTLQNGIDSLQKKVPAKIEKTAREKYGMTRTGETTIEIKQK